MHNYSSHFTSFNTINGILFELYVIRQNGLVNKRNFTIDAIVNEYERFKNTNNIRVGGGAVTDRHWSPFARMGNWVARKWYGDDIDDLDTPPKDPEVIAEEEGDAIDEAARKIGSKLGKIMKPVLEKHDRDEKAKAKRINNSIKFVTGDFDLFGGMHNSDIELDGNRSIDSKKSISEDDIDSSLLIASDNDDEEDEEI